jgi:hypothetical protein
MRLTITFPADVAKKLCRLPSRDEFATQATKEALAQEARPAKRLVQTIESESTSLGHYHEQFKRDLRRNSR